MEAVPDGLAVPATVAEGGCDSPPAARAQPGA